MINYFTDIQKTIRSRFLANKIYNKTLILGCRSNYECMMMNPNKPICDSDGMCVGGLSSTILSSVQLKHLSLQVFIGILDVTNISIYF